MSSINDTTDGKLLIIGATGAIGQELVAALIRKYGKGSVVACLNRTPLPAELADDVIQEFGVDVRNQDKLDEVVSRYADSLWCAWNLAAPLSVETDRDPQAAYDVTVKGMSNLLSSLSRYCRRGAVRVCFSDSIGSFGASAPRQDASARWLVEHPEQDPGSDYGRQKREIRELLQRSELDTRWAVIPGVLHAKGSWGAGTTEYALDAILCAVEQRLFQCPVPLDVQLPMIYQSDLIDGLVALTQVDRSQLTEPEGGYAIAGLSFSAQQLLDYLQSVYPSFSFLPPSDETGAAARFSRLWPDSISSTEAARDLHYTARFNNLEEIVNVIINAHKHRLAKE